MAVLIKVDQAAAPPGVPGQAREDLVTGVGVTLTAVGGPFLAYAWSIISKPIDISIPVEASSLLGSPTASTSTLSPIDVAGTYLVEVAVDSGSGLGALAGDIARITFYAGPTLAVAPTELPRREMAAFESTEHNVPDAIQPLGNTQGWSREWYRWFAAIKASVTLTLTATINAIANSLALRTSTGNLRAVAYESGPAYSLGASLTTLDATPTVILSIPFADDALLTGTIQFLAETPGVGIFQIVYMGGVTYTSGGVLQAPLGAPTSNTTDTYGGPSPTFDTVYNSPNLQFRAIGIAATTIKWVARGDFVVQLAP